MIVDKFSVKFWNGQYYCSVIFPDGSRQELKSATDLTFSGWQAEIEKAWAASQVPPELPKTSLTEYADAEIKAEFERRKLTVGVAK